jgi:hypothetical protein
LARLALKFEKVPIWLKNKFCEKNQKGINKRIILCRFQICWKSFKKIYKKKVINKNVMEICTFSTFTHVRQTCFAYNFFGAFFKNLFNGFEINMKFCAFDAFFDCFSKKFLKVILVLFQTWSQTSKKRS